MWILLGTGFATAGLTGMVGFQQAENLANLFNKAAPDEYRIRTPKEIMFTMGAPQWVTMGPASAISGVDIQAKTSMADLLPDSVGDAFVPGVSFVGNVLEQGRKHGVMAAAHAALPASLKGASENLFFTDKDGTVRQPGTGKVMYRRTDKEQMYRWGNLKSTDESEAAQKLRFFNERETQRHAKEQSLVEAWGADMVAARDNPIAQRKAGEKFAQKWIAAGLDPNPDKMIAAIQQKNKEINLTPEEREKLKASSNPARYQRFRELRYGQP
jgi:hypothetical protein